MEKLTNKQAEQIVLGALILNNNFYDKIDFLKSEFFSDNIHKLIYQYITNLIKVGKKSDDITLSGFFNNEIEKCFSYSAEELVKLENKKEQKRKGLKYLSILLSMGAGIVDIVDYAKIIQDLYKKREIIKVCEIFKKTTFNKFNQIKSDDLIENLKLKLDKIENETGFIYNVKNIKNPLIERLLEIKLSIEKNEIYNKDIIPSGFYDFDKLFNGFTKGELTILAGCSSMGKTTFALQLSLNFIKKSLNTIFFSLEMNNKSVINKILANKNNINSQRINHNNIYSTEINKVLENSNQFKESTLFIDDTYAINTNSINKILKRFKRKHKEIDVIIVDYLQIMQDTYKEKNRVREIGNITNGLKEIAKKFNCVVICLSQVSRNVESRDNKRPILRDLRDSGEIEQIADMVMFVYRHHYYEKRKLSKFDKDKKEERETYEKIKYKLDKIKNDLEILVRKNRNGRCGDVKLHFEGRFSKIISKDEVYREYNSKKIPYIE